MTNFKARPTVYNGTRMRSRLEAGFAQWLDQCGFEWEYEPECFASEAGQYLPDFLVTNMPIVGGIVDRTYIEVKPTPQPPYAREASHLEKQLAVIWTSHPDALILNVYPRPVGANEAGVAWSGVSFLAHMAPDIIEAWGAPGALIPVQWVSAVGSSGLGPRFGVGRRIAAPSSLPWPDGYWRVGDGS